MFFDGSARERKPVSLAGRKKAHSTSQETAAKSAQDRAARELLHRKKTAAVRLQSQWRRILARRVLETAVRAAFDASLLAVKRAQQLQQALGGTSGDDSSSSSTGGSVCDLNAEVVLQMSRHLAVFYRPHIYSPTSRTAFTGASASFMREDRLRLKALMGLLLHLVRRPDSLRRWLAMWGEVCSGEGTEPSETFKRPARQVEVWAMLAPMKAIFAILVRTANSSLTSISQPLDAASAAVDVRTELLLPLQVFQVLVNTAKTNPEALRPLCFALGGVNAAVLQLFTTLSEQIPKPGDEQTYLTVANFVAFFLNQLVEMRLKLSQDQKQSRDSLLLWMSLPYYSTPSPSSAPVIAALQAVPIEFWVDIFVSKLHSVVLQGTSTAKPQATADAIQSDNGVQRRSKGPCSQSSLLIPSLYSQESRHRRVVSGNLEVIAFLQNTAALLLLPYMESSSGVLSDVRRGILSAWFALFDSVLHFDGISSDMPIRTALFYLDTISAFDRPKLLVRIDLRSYSDDADGIVRPRVVVVAEDDPTLPAWMHTASTASSSHTAMELDSDVLISSDVPSRTSEAITERADTDKVPSYASLGGLRVDSSLYPLFMHAIAMEDMHSWNKLVNTNPEFCSMLIKTIKFALGPQVLSELCRDAADLAGDLELRVVSVYSKLIAAGGVAFPGRPTARPLHITKSHSTAQYPMEYNKAVCSIMNAIGFDSRKPPMIRRLWSAFLNGRPRADTSQRLDDGSFVTLFRNAFDYNPSVPNEVKVLTAENCSRMRLADVLLCIPSCHPISIFYVLCISLSHQLTTIDDEAFYDGVSSLNAVSGEVATLLSLLKQVLYHLYWTKPILLLPFENRTAVPKYNSDAFGVLMSDRVTVISFLQACSRLYNQLAVRNERRTHFAANSFHTSIFRLTDSSKRQFGIISTDDFIWTGSKHSTLAAQDPSTVTSRSGRSTTASSTTAPSYSRLAIDTASVVSSEVTQAVWDLGSNSKFKFVDARFQVVLINIPEIIRFEQRTSILLNLIKGDDEGGVESLHRSAVVRIRRNHILADAFTAFGSMSGLQLRQKFRVYFVSAAGHEEAGVDGGGLYKEFLECFMQAAFDPSAGYFDTTESMELIPSSQNRYSLEFYNFIGKMLAKAVYSGILLEPQFSPVFLNLLLGRSNQIDDMSYLDEQFYKSMMRIKRMVWSGEDISCLGLHFQTLEGEDIVPNGHNIAVTNSNGIEYLLRLSKYKLNTRYAAACEAFLSGFREVVPLLWIRMFNAREMQYVLGGELRPLNLVDLKNNVNYSGGYHESQPYIQMFWDVVEELSAEEQGDFLKFITSCSRQPLLGFGRLSPKIGIQEVPMRYPDDPPNSSPRLPSASTCFNLLKLPRYSSKDMLRDKLKYAITSHAGFELS